MAPAATKERLSHSPEPCADLRQRFYEGDPLAIDELAGCFFDDVLRFSIALLRDEDLAMEAVQETFLRLLERHTLYAPHRPFRPWLFTVCRNCCLGILRQRSSHQARIIDMEPSDEEVSRLASDCPTAFEELVCAERESEALEALQTLPETTRTIIMLHLFESMTFREIGEMLERPQNTVATTYYRALRDLRERMTPEDSISTAGKRTQHAAGNV